MGIGLRRSLSTSNITRSCAPVRVNGSDSTNARSTGADIGAGSAGADFWK